MWKTPFAFFLIVMCVAACASGRAANSQCIGFRVITPEMSDIDAISETLARQILAHNEFGQRLGCWSAP